MNLNYYFKTWGIKTCFYKLRRAIPFISFAILVLLPGLTNAQPRQIIINPSVTCQKIEYFTASDAWSGNFVGKYWNKLQKDQIAQWLFSSKLDKTGNPEGIGLSMWRVNLGAGTLEQDSADIVPYQRRAESFMARDGQSYDWNKCLGQQYFMQKAVDYGCNNFLLFSNSPLVQYTKNGKGWSYSGKFANIKPDCYGQYADYMANVARYFITKKSWNIAYISPINEPQTFWGDSRQEGSQWKSSEMKKMYVELDKSLAKKGLDNVRIFVGETCTLSNLYDKTGSNTVCSKEDEPELQISTFFNPKSPCFIGNLKSVPKIISGHDYGTHLNNQVLKEIRKKLKAEADKYGVSFHESEWCLLPGIKEQMDGFTPDWEHGNYSGIQPALLLGRLVYGDIVYANSHAWGYWKGMEINGDHALIALYPKDGKIENGGNIRSNKMLWALGNYSFFIRPGYTRVELQGADDLNSLVASAYLAPDKSQLVIVYVNSSFDKIEVHVTLPKDYAHKVKKLSAYRTDESSDLTNMYIPEKAGGYIIPPRSLVTMVFDL
ncbi:MAG: glycoside hydrolase [Bacteroidota bacterium]|nr:glycoside hydrolase [Bacteroidota bacterium]